MRTLIIGMLAIATAGCGSSAPPAAAPAAPDPKPAEPSDGPSIKFTCRAGIISFRGSDPLQEVVLLGWDGVMACQGDQVVGNDELDDTGGTDGTFELACEGGGRFRLNAGTGEGRCGVWRDDESGRLLGASCRDAGGNRAVAICTLKGGQGDCYDTIVKGTCEAAGAP